MNEEKKYYKLNWYLPDKEDKEKIVKIPVDIKSNSCNDMESNISDGYLAQIIKDFYYAEALRRVVNADAGNNIFLKINKLNDMHGDVILLKRIFNDVLESSKEIMFKRNEKQIIDENIWNEINEKLGFFHNDFDIVILMLSRELHNRYYVRYDEFDKIKMLFEEVRRCYDEEDIEELINARQKLLREVRNSLFTKNDEDKFIRLWIKIYGLICRMPNLKDFNMQDINEAIKFIDEFLGERQRQICCCMMSYSQNAYDKITKQNGHIRKFLWYLKCNKEIKAVYIAKTERKRCYSLMWSKKEQNKYFALSGIDREQYYGNLLMKLVPEHLHYEQVILNDNVRYYFNYKEFIEYGEIKNKKNKKIKRLMSCCERKLLTKVTDPGNKYYMFIKLEPCEKCKRAFYDYDTQNQIDIIAPKGSYKENRKKIKKEDALANDILKM